MPCDDEMQQVVSLWRDVEDADLALANARRKLDNRLDTSLVACGSGALLSFGGIPGLLTGGAACLTALFAADDSAADYEYAVARARLAHQRHADAVISHVLCLSHCNPEE